MSLFSRSYNWLNRRLGNNKNDWLIPVINRQLHIPVVKPVIIECIGHDPSAFTQGLTYQEGCLYESTGLYGNSSLRKIDAGGQILSCMPVPGLFCEGLALLANEIVQLTWRDKVAVRYSFPDLKRLGVFTYEGEGWGLTAASQNFYMSNGSGMLFERDQNFNIIGKKKVRLGNKIVDRLNDLQYARGFVYANVWKMSFLLEINVQTGSVSRIIDCSELVNIENNSLNEGVLNGIAYCEEEDIFYLTGKCWNNLFVVKIPGL